MKFADANAEYNNSNIVIVGVPFDGTASFRDGARLAPDRIREASYNFETYYPEYDAEITELSFCDLGNLNVNSVEDTALEVKKNVEKVLNDGKMPILLGGEHSITIHSASVFKELCDGFFISLDAHLDLRDAYEETKYSHACVARRVFERFGEDMALIGIRSGSKEEYAFLKEMGIASFSAENVKSRGVKDIVRAVKKRSFGRKIYLSLDMDVIDISFAPGTENPEPYGLNPSEVRAFISGFSKEVSAFDLVEVSPKYDYGETSLLAARLIRDLIMEKYFG